MSGLLGKFSFGKSKEDIAAKSRKKQLIEEEGELQRFVASLGAEGKELERLVREASTTLGVPCDVTSTDIESMVSTIVQRQPARSFALPITLCRLLLARFDGHLNEPSVRLPVATETLAHLTQGATAKLVQLGLVGVLEKVFDVAINELEMRTQSSSSPLRASHHAHPQEVDDHSGQRDGNPLYLVMKYGLTALMNTCSMSKEPTDRAARADPATPSSPAATLAPLAFWKSEKPKEKDSLSGMDLFEALISKRSPILTAIQRLFGLQCRCSLPSRFCDSNLAVAIFDSTVTTLKHICFKVPSVAREISLDVGILLVRVTAALEDANDSSIVLDRAKVEYLLLQGGASLRLMGLSLAQWPVECGHAMATEGMFAQHFGKFLSAAARSKLLLSSDYVPSSGPLMQQICVVFNEFMTTMESQTQAGLALSNPLAVLSTKLASVDSLLVQMLRSTPHGQWLDDLTAFYAYVRSTRDVLSEISYRRDALSAKADEAIVMVELLECHPISTFSAQGRNGSFTTSPLRDKRNEADDEAVAAPEVDAATPVGSSADVINESLMHIWLLSHLLALLPTGTQNIRPAERSKVALLRRLVRSGGLLEYLWCDHTSGWCNPSRQVFRCAVLSFACRYVLLRADYDGKKRKHDGRGAQPSESQSPCSDVLHSLLEAIERHCQTLSTLRFSRSSVTAAVIPLCALLKWSTLQNESETVDCLVTLSGTLVLASAAAALAKEKLSSSTVREGVSNDTHTNQSPNGSFDSTTLTTTGLMWVTSTLEHLMTYRAIVQFQLQHEPTTIFHLLLFPLARRAACTILSQLLCYDGEGDTDAVYNERMASLVTDLWELTTNGQQVPDEVYVTVICCVRRAIEDACLKGPFLQSRLQNALGSARYAPDCYVRLVHPLHSGWKTISSSEGRGVVLSIIATMIRANPAQRERLLTTVGEVPLVKSAVMASKGLISKTLVTELLALIFEEGWVDKAGGGVAPRLESVSVQNERILEALLTQFEQDLQVHRDANDEASTDSAIESLMLVIEKLRSCFAHCRASVWACSSRHVFEHLVLLLSYLKKQKDVDSMESCLSLLTARHIDIRQLKRLLGVISHAKSVELRRRLVPSVIQILHAACYTHISARGEPKNYIAFRSKSGPCGISVAVPSFPRNGYTVSMWVRWEGAAPSKGCTPSASHWSAGEHVDTVTLLSVSDSSGQTTAFQVSIARDGSLVALLRPAANGGSTTTACPIEGFQLQLQQWSHVVLSHKTTMFGGDELAAFINGKELRCVRVPYPQQNSAPIGLVVGNNYEMIAGKMWCPSFHGQCGAVYVFSKAFGAKEAYEMYSLGSNYATCFLPSEKATASSRAQPLYESNTGEKVLVCIDPRLSEKGKLFNAADVSRIAVSGRAATTGQPITSNAGVAVTLQVGSFTCHTSSIIDTTCSLGALQSLILPLLCMQVNAQLPISLRGISLDAESLLPSNPTILRDTLKLLDSLIVVDVVRAEALSIGAFHIIALVLEKLGPCLAAEIPHYLGKLCTSLSELPDVFEAYFQAILLSYSLFVACSSETQKALINNLRSMSKLEHVRKSMRELGLHPFLGSILIRHCNRTTADDAILRDIIFSLLETTMSDPITSSDAETIHAVLSSVASVPLEVAENLMCSCRRLILSRPITLTQLLGKHHALATLVGLLRHDSVCVRCEACRLIGAIALRSKVAQKTLYPSGTSGTGSESQEVQIDEISLSVIADKLRNFPITRNVYYMLRAALTGSTLHIDLQSDKRIPLSDSERLVLAPMLVPILMLVRESPRDLCLEALADLTRLVDFDTHAWQSIAQTEGWYILIIDVMLADEDDTAVSKNKRTYSLECDDFDEGGSSVNANLFSASNDDVVETGIHLLASMFGRMVCSPSHDTEDIDLALTYIQRIRHDRRVRRIAHSIENRILDECIARNGGSVGSVQSASGLSLNGGAASPHRQSSLFSIPKIERNLQQFFFSLEDELFYNHDIAAALKSVKNDGFVIVETDDLQYDEHRSHVFKEQRPEEECAGDDLRSPSPHPHSPPMSPIASPRDSTSAQCLHRSISRDWLHADLAIKSLQFISSSVSLANNSTTLSNPGTASADAKARKGGMQRIYLRILRSAITILPLYNDYVETVLFTVKSFQSLLDKGNSSLIFAGKKSVPDVLEDPCERSILSLILSLVFLLNSRKNLRGGAGGRNRFINQRIIERLKSLICDNISLLKGLGAFEKQSPAHLDSTHRVAVKTLDWLENPRLDEPDEYIEISQRDDFQTMIRILTDAVGVMEQGMSVNIRDVSIRYHSNCVSKSQQVLKRLVLTRHTMMEKLDTFVASDEVKKELQSARENVVGDANAAKIAASVLYTSWNKFVGRLKGTIWDVDHGAKGIKYVKLNRVEQRPLAHYKLLRDPDGTDHRDITQKDSSKNDDDVEDFRQSKSVVRLKERGNVTLGEATDTELEPVDDEQEADDFGAASLTTFYQSDDISSAHASPSSTTNVGRVEKNVRERAELSYLMHCWSCSVVVSDSTLTVLIDDENVAYNQIIAKEAAQYLLRPRNMMSWSLQDIHMIAPARRFRMRRVAVEVFFRDKSSVLLNFPSPEAMRKVAAALKRGGGSYTRRGEAKPIPVLVWNENPRKELARQRVTDLWRNHQITNFEYLLHLNALAGRTVNDVTQYPVFPWIVADYKSDELDLTSPETFRDLSQPVGLCGGPGRREEIAMRFDEMRQMGDVPFHYFTHYSSPAVVLYFLVRLEPFTTCQILLQGGRFDHADRMFHSVSASWAGVTKNIQDVKEMVPECYYLPEMYLNNNNVRFGAKQDKSEMSHAVLPPWAQGDPYTLVFRLREALECEYVSSQLHHWIDLIFGCKQRGKEAVEALNLFHPHTYEVEQSGGNNVNADALESPEDRNIVIDSLDNIGQTPIQLFLKRHPERKPLVAVNPITDPSYFGFKRVPLSQTQNMDRIAVVKILPNERLVVLCATGAALLYRWTRSVVALRRESTTPTSRNRLEGVMKRIEDFRAASVSFDISADPESRGPALPSGCMPSVCGEVLATLGAVGGSVRQTVGAACYAPCSWRNSAVLHLGDAIFCVHGGFFDNSCVIRALSIQCEELRFTSHRDRVCCLAASADSQYLVTAGKDTTFIAWRLSFKTRLNVELMFSICGHEDEPSAVAVCNVMDVVVSASCDGEWKIHSLSNGKLEHSLRHPKGHVVDFVLIQPHCFVPNILICSKTDYEVHQYSVNGSLLRSIGLPGRLVHWVTTSDPTQTMMLLTPINVLSSDPSSILFAHSFFLTTTSRINPTDDEQQCVPAGRKGEQQQPNSGGCDTWLTCVDCCSNQVMISGTASGDVILIRAEAASAR